MSFEPDEMMMELFRSEVDTHSESLTSFLLALEQDPTATTTLERMMRAAHSIKGAARIVRVNPAVDVAHVMEDCFVAAQKGKLTLKPDDVDVLLRGVDVLVRISAATRDSATDWAAFDDTVQGIVAALQTVLEDRPAAPVVATGAPKAVGSPAPAGSASAIPAPPPLRDAGASEVISCPEFLDAAAADRVRLRLLTALKAGCRDIRFDLAATRDLDAIGLAFLAAARDFVTARPDTTLRFQPVSTDMQVVLQLTGLDAAATGAADR